MRREKRWRPPNPPRNPLLRTLPQPSRQRPSSRIPRSGRPKRRLSTRRSLRWSPNGKTRDAERVSFGVRTLLFDVDKGFFLNGKSVKVKGTCNHQDHAGVGAALPDRLQFYRVAVLKEMGSNAVRTSHNMPTPEWVEACDRLGMMMMCETRMMSSTRRRHGATRSDGEALQELAVDHPLVHGQRGVGIAEPPTGRARREDMVAANS